MRKALAALVVASSLLVTDAAIAQDSSAGIWAARPRVKRHVEESVPASALPGLAVGLPVRNGSGKTIGSVVKIVTANDGSIRKVVVSSLVGNMMNLSPTALSVANGVVTVAE